MRSSKMNIIKKKSSKYIIGGLILAVIAIIVISNTSPTTLAIFNPFSKKATFDIYVMSQCPYGVQVEDNLFPVYEKMKDSVDFNIYYIAREQDGVFQSLHGQEEIDGNIMQLCANKHYPDKGFDFINCQNEDYSDLVSSVDSCSESLGLDADKIKECFNSQEGKDLLSVSIKQSEKVNALGSPTMYINNEPYNGARDSLSLQRAICKYVPNHNECKNIPICSSDSDCPEKEGKIPKCENPNKETASCTYLDPVQVEVTILNDESCKSCSTEQLKEATKGHFPGATFNEIDISSEQGKELIEKYSIKFVPAFLFSKEVVNTYTWKNQPVIQTVFEDLEDYYKLNDATTGASHFVNEEERKEHYESIGIKLGDNKPQIDFFVMSYCPYGNQAEEIIYEVYKNLGDSVEYNPHYIIYSNYAGGGSDYCIDEDSKYCSMHGAVELNQDLRELCVNELYGIESWFEFVVEMNEKCDYKNADTCWSGVAESLSLDTEKIKTCFENNKIKYSKEELELNELLGVTGSPTIFIDGDKYQGQRSSNSIQSTTCGYFDDAPEECGNVLEETSDSVASGACE